MTTPAQAATHSAGYDYTPDEPGKLSMRKGDAVSAVQPQPRACPRTSCCAPPRARGEGEATEGRVMTSRLKDTRCGTPVGGVGYYSEMSYPEVPGVSQSYGGIFKPRL